MPDVYSTRVGRPPRGWLRSGPLSRPSTCMYVHLFGKFIDAAEVEQRFLQGSLFGVLLPCLPREVLGVARRVNDQS